jgi:hypothetical protein
MRDSLLAFRKSRGADNFAGVTFVGDLTADGKKWERTKFNSLYKANFRSYPALGNHDFYYLNDFGKNAYDTIAYYKGVVVSSLGISNIDSLYTTEQRGPHSFYYRKGSQAYSYDIGDKHFVVLAGYPSLKWRKYHSVGITKAYIVDTNESYAWLANDLNNNKSKKVFMFMHEFWRAGSDTAFKDIVKKHSNIQAYFYGHYMDGNFHMMRKTTFFDGNKSRYAFQCGAPHDDSSHNRYLDVHVYNDKLVVNSVDAYGGTYSRSSSCDGCFGTFTAYYD